MFYSLSNQIRTRRKSLSTVDENSVVESVGFFSFNIHRGSDSLPEGQTQSDGGRVKEALARLQQEGMRSQLHEIKHIERESDLANALAGLSGRGEWSVE